MLHQAFASNTSSVYAPLKEFYKVSFMNWSTLGFLVTLAVGIVVSRMTSPPKVVDERCIFSLRKHMLNELLKDKSNGPSNNVNEETKMLDQRTNNVFNY